MSARILQFKSQEASIEEQLEREKFILIAYYKQNDWYRVFWMFETGARAIYEDSGTINEVSPIARFKSRVALLKHFKTFPHAHLIAPELLADGADLRPEFLAKRKQTVKQVVITYIP